MVKCCDIGAVASHCSRTACYLNLDCKRIRHIWGWNVPLSLGSFAVENLRSLAPFEGACGMRAAEKDILKCQRPSRTQ